MAEAAALAVDESLGDGVDLGNAVEGLLGTGKPYCVSDLESGGLVTVSVNCGGSVGQDRTLGGESYNHGRRKGLNLGIVGFLDNVGDACAGSGHTFLGEGQTLDCTGSLDADGSCTRSGVEVLLKCDDVVAILGEVGDLCPVGIDGNQDGLHLGCNIEGISSCCGADLLGGEGGIDEGLLDLDDAHVDELDSAAVDGLGAFHGHFVADFDSEACPAAFSILRILALGVEGSVDVEVGFGSAVVHIPVAIRGIGNADDGSGDAVGLAFIAGENLSDCRGLDLDACGGLLVDLYDLDLGAHGEMDLGATGSRGSFRSSEGHGHFLSGSAGGGIDSKPVDFCVGNSSSPGIISLDLYGNGRTFVSRDGYVVVVDFQP